MRESKGDWSPLPDFDPQEPKPSRGAEPVWQPIRSDASAGHKAPSLESAMSSFPMHVLDGLKTKAQGDAKKGDQMPPAVRKRKNKLLYATTAIAKGDHRTLWRMLSRDPTLATESSGNGHTLLHGAALQGNVEATDVLLLAGADARGLPSSDEPEMEMSQTPLSLALVGHHCAGCTLFEVCSDQQLSTMNLTRNAHLDVTARLLASASVPHLMSDAAVDVLFHGGSHRPLQLLLKAAGKRLSHAASTQGSSALHFVLKLIPDSAMAWANVLLDQDSSRIERTAYECGHEVPADAAASAAGGWVSWKTASSVLGSSTAQALICVHCELC